MARLFPLLGLAAFCLLFGLQSRVAHTAAAPTFPDLTSRVVDEADILSATQEQTIAQMLEAHEHQTSNQMVVVTAKSLQGYSIEEYGVRLGRHWGIGQDDKDNGALLIVAPAERRVRIEVGYGLEDRLTDAISTAIIETRILPRFRQDDYPGGIRAGVESILKVIAGTYTPLPDGSDLPFLTPVGLILLVIGAFMIFAVVSTYQDREAARNSIYSGWRFGRSGRSRDLDRDAAFSNEEEFGNRGFSGGGGSSGGGGASGSW